MKHPNNPRAQLRRDLNSGKVAQQPRTEDEKNAARAEQLSEAVATAFEGTDWAVHTIERDDRTVTLTFRHTEKGLSHVDALSTRVGDVGLTQWIAVNKVRMRELELEHADERE